MLSPWAPAEMIILALRIRWERVIEGQRGRSVLGHIIRNLQYAPRRPIDVSMADQSDLSKSRPLNIAVILIGKSSS